MYVSLSSTEAEIVAACVGVFNYGIPMLDGLEYVWNKKMTMNLMEDNQACQRIIEVGRSDKMGHIKRTHKVNIAALHERLVAKDFIIQYINTEYQCADPFTKAITCKETWIRSLTNINMFKTQDIWKGYEPVIVNVTPTPDPPVANIFCYSPKQHRQFCARQSWLQANRTGIEGAYCSDRCKTIDDGIKQFDLTSRRNNRQQHFQTIPTFPALYASVAISALGSPTSFRRPKSTLLRVALSATLLFSSANSFQLAAMEPVHTGKLPEVITDQGGYRHVS